MWEPLKNKLWMSSHKYLSQSAVRSGQSVVFLVDKTVLLCYRWVISGQRRLKMTIRATCYQCIRVAASLSWQWSSENDRKIASCHHIVLKLTIFLQTEDNFFFKIFLLLKLLIFLNTRTNFAGFFFFIFSINCISNIVF